MSLTNEMVYSSHLTNTQYCLHLSHAETVAELNLLEYHDVQGTSVLSALWRADHDYAIGTCG